VNHRSSGDDLKQDPNKMSNTKRDSINIKIEQAHNGIVTVNSPTKLSTSNQQQGQLQEINGLFLAPKIQERSRRSLNITIGSVANYAFSRAGTSAFGQASRKSDSSLPLQRNRLKSIDKKAHEMYSINV
jgi:hypothetical protein